MEGCADAVGKELAFRLAEGEGGGERDAGAGLHLALEGVAVEVEDAGQDVEAAGVEGAGRTRAADGVDAAVVQQEVDGGEAFGEQDVPAFDPQRHVPCLSDAGGVVAGGLRGVTACAGAGTTLMPGHAAHL